MPPMNECYVNYNKRHLNKISVLLDTEKKLEEVLLKYDSKELWKVEIRYKELITGNFDYWFNELKSALVDEIRLIERVF